MAGPCNFPVGINWKQTRELYAFLSPPPRYSTCPLQAAMRTSLSRQHVEFHPRIAILQDVLIIVSGILIRDGELPFSPPANDRSKEKIKKTLLLGLEFLIAADIIETVTFDLTPPDRLTRVVIEAGGVDNSWRMKTVGDLLTRVVDNLIARLSGPMKFRLIIQPVMASIFAVRDGIKDAREKRPPFFRAIFTHPDSHSKMLRDGWNSAGKIFVIAIIIDLVEQLFFFRSFYPGEALLVALILAFIPYLLIRGPVNGIAQSKQRGATGDKRL